jgi:hypothetical protein
MKIKQKNNRTLMQIRRDSNKAILYQVQMGVVCLKLIVTQTLATRWSQ